LALNISALPKIELHLHLDCSLSYEVVQQLLPSITYESYRSRFVVPSGCPGLNAYLEKALEGIALMQTADQLKLVTLDLFRQLQQDGVIYAEIRFAPLEHTRQGLSLEKVVEIVEAATQQGIRETGIQAGLILCTLRHYSQTESLQTVQLVEQFRNTTVVGFDIAADELGYPIDNHIAAFTYAREKGLPCTAHAGEARGPESVWETLEFFKPSRIGHGVRSVEDAQLLEHLKDHNIHLEVCPTSNVHTHAVASLEDHPVDVLYQSGVSLSINTDGRTVSDVSLKKEYANLQETFAWTKAHFLRCNLAAVEHAFTTPAVKESLRQKLQAAYG
jgi:adenosine deaminase